AKFRIDTDFRRVIEETAEHTEGVTALAKAERALELLDAGLVKTDVDRAALERTVAKLSAVPEVRQATDALRSYYRDLLKYQLDNGAISPEKYQEIVAKGQYYIPFVPDEAAEAMRRESTGRGTAGRF